MIRQREKEVVWQAGAFTVLVHGLLLALLLMSFQWKTVKPMSIAEVELWDSIPTPQSHAELPPPEPTPEPPKVVEPVKVEPKPEPAPEPKADIQVKKEPPKPEKIEKPKLEKVKEEKPKPEPKPAKQDPEALKKLQQALLEEDAKLDKQETTKPAANPAGEKTAQKAQAGVANPTEMAKYVGLISATIRPNVISQLCGTDKATKLTFLIALMPTGELMAPPKLLKSSNLPACDAAVERAILKSQPLPVPKSADLFSQFRDLKLEFSPNTEN
jgi:colicin import membrane protein